MPIRDERHEIGIINFALSQLSIDPIASLEEKTKVVDTMARQFLIAKESVLREYVFDWSHKAEKLVQYGDEKGGYVKPSDYINFIGLGDECNFCCCTEGWKNLVIYSHKSSVREVNSRLYIQACCCDKYDYIHYAYNNLNYADMPSDLFEAIGFKLAYLAGMLLTKDQNVVNFALQRFEDSLKRSVRHSALENKPLASEKVYRYPISPSCGGFF